MPASPNQNPEQIARDIIDAQLRTSGWAVQDKNEINFNECEGQAIREYTTDTGPADYVLFVDTKPVGIIEANRKAKRRTSPQSRNKPVNTPNKKPPAKPPKRQKRRSRPANMPNSYYPINPKSSANPSSKKSFSGKFTLSSS